MARHARFRKDGEYGPHWERPHKASARLGDKKKVVKKLCLACNDGPEQCDNPRCQMQRFLRRVK